MTFYLAWTDPPGTAGAAFGPEHQVEHEIVHAFTITQNEGDLPTLSIDIKNPRIGLLNAARKTWAWLSWSADGTSGAVPLFFGRLVGIPTNILAEIVTLTLVAKPVDYETKRAELADTLRVLPFYDEVFVDQEHRADSDAVLEGYSKIWHVDRVSHDLTVSDIMSGEDGTEEFQESDVPYDSVAISLEQAPLTSVSVDATVNWKQAFAGTIDFGTFNFTSYTGDGIVSDWPKTGAKLAGGYEVASASVIDVYGIGSTEVATINFKYTNREKTHENGDTLSQNESRSGPTLRGAAAIIEVLISDKMQVGIVDPFSDPPVNVPALRQTNKAIIPAWLVSASLVLGYGSDRQRSERIRFTLHSDLQAILTEPDAAQSTDLITLTGADVSVPIADGSTAGFTPPIADAGRRSYFPTDRGLRSIEYLISVARAHLLWRARVVRVSFDCAFDRVIDLSCRKNAILHDHRLPGGQAEGKIVTYAIKGDGNSGKFNGTITIACGIGFGGIVTADPGVPSYVEVDVIDPSTQVQNGDLVLVDPTAADVGYSTPVDVPNDDGLVFPLTKSDVVVLEQIHGNDQTQLAALEAFGAALAAGTTNADQDAIEDQLSSNMSAASQILAIMKANPVFYELQLKNLTGKSFETLYDLSLSKLQVPKQIDLEAASA